jgi:hypothetical protein
MSPRRGNVWLMTLVLVVVPAGGIFLLLYAAGLLASRKRRAPVAASSVTDPYEEWLRSRDLVPSRGIKPDTDFSRSQRS